MPVNKSPASRTPTKKRPADALERLYGYWILSTAVLAFALVASVLAMRGALSQQASLYAGQQEALENLTKRVEALEATGGHGEVATAPATTAEENPPAEPELPPSFPVPGVRPSPPPVNTTPPTPPVSEPTREPPPPDGPVMGTLLDKALVAGTLAPLVIGDRAAAEEVTATGLRYLRQAEWSGDTWARCAIVARLLDQHAAAERFAEAAYRAGDPLTAFSEVSARVFLDEARPTDALLHAQHFDQQTEGSPTARVLLARVALALDNPASADEIVAGVAVDETLSVPDRLALGRVCLALERWEQLAQVMDSIQTAPPALERERNFLYAVALIQRGGNLAEAGSVLAYLAAEGPGDEPAAGATGPDTYEITLWQGVALLHGRQVAAARETLERAAGLRADRPEAYYWRAVLAYQDGDVAGARLYLQNALATSARYAPAWEMLGQLALNEGDLTDALTNLRKAVEVNERRASAHFAIALAHAKAARREPAAAALHRALVLDPTYLETARHAEVITRLFTEEELMSLLTQPLYDN
ncbi:MAG: tetratricopeptide repeat protein [Phycisphaerae bacterium]